MNDQNRIDSLKNNIKQQLNEEQEATITGGKGSLDDNGRTPGGIRYTTRNYRCPNCASETPHDIYKSGNTYYYRCRYCGHLRRI